MNIKELFTGKVIYMQTELNEQIGEYFEKLENGDTNVYIIILGISFLYGLIHAIGPGHGKVAIASYFLARGKKIKDAIKAGFLTSLIHTCSALLIVGVLYILFEGMFASYFAKINHNMYKVSAVFLIFIALYMFYELFFHHEHAKCEVQNKDVFAIAFSIGIVPCPGVMSIVLYSVIIGYFTLGFFSAVFMSLGMGITISIAGIIASKMKFANSSGVILNIFGFLGASFLFAFGLLLLS